ncbi:MAG: DUF2797 domain-containing protein [Crocinitomicaceae bacterium]|nr:DUF2797 domain-containing protein [Crocinitomicaceae bacterium]
MTLAVGNIRKMTTRLGDQVEYTLNLSKDVMMNDLIGQEICLEWLGKINCTNCGKITKSSFGQGFCYTCFTTAPESAECIIRPELCRAHLGEGRDPEWEQKHHNRPHIVYLAASSAIKVGITRIDQVPTRWIDQGASSAIRLAETPNRYESGRVEVALKEFFTDKTNWQKMLKNDIDESIDLVEAKWELEEHLPADIIELFSENDEIIELNYPVLEYPSKVKSLNFDKSPTVRGKLVGIKGQYLLFEGGEVINIRRHTGYHVEIK